MRVSYKSEAATFTHKADFYPKPLTDEEYIRYFYADVVHSARALAGWTQEELAKRANTSQAVISRIEKGNWQSIKSLQRVLRQFNFKFQVKFVPKQVGEVDNIPVQKKGRTK